MRSLYWSISMRWRRDECASLAGSVKKPGERLRSAFPQVFRFLGSRCEPPAQLEYSVDMAKRRMKRAIGQIAPSLHEPQTRADFLSASRGNPE